MAGTTKKAWVEALRPGKQLVPRRRAAASDAPALEAEPAQDLWIDVVAAYKSRQPAAAPAAEADPEAAFVPGGQNWASLGPSVLMHGQALGNPPVAGRIAGLAVAPDGQRVYAASANGGVFRSDDGGVTWRSMMDAFDLDPTNFASTSLACGAIAINPADPERVYVGTGEGDTHSMFDSRIVHALPAYRGIGPIRSDNGGGTWTVERTAAGSPPLAGKAFFSLAVDPNDPEHVIAATTEGLYQRVVATGQPEWALRRPNVCSSVIAVTRNGTTFFYAAAWGGSVVLSDDGATWTPVGNGFPTTATGRIALAAQPRDPNVVYALVTDDGGGLHGLHRLDVAAAAWTKLTNPPPALLPSGYGNYNLAIAVDPEDDALVYLGGSRDGAGASIQRCRVSATGTIASASIGRHAHADVHVLVHTPGDSNMLWTGCDGGVFVNRNPREGGIFTARNNGLACLCPNFIAQHPTDPSILYCGLQDNGTANTLGGAAWTHIIGGDGGYCVVNWANPDQILAYANGAAYRSTDGGRTVLQSQDFGFRLMTYPIVGTPMNAAQPAEANIVALAAVHTIHVSTDFGITWPPAVTIPGAEIYSLVFASPTRLFAGTTDGDVYRVEKTGANWTATRIDNTTRGALGLRGPITDIAVDWSDRNRTSIYVTLGGTGDYSHVWRYNGTKWEARSGAPNANNLLDIEHNAITVDPENNDHVYAGADIGVWHSTDGGKNWQPLPNGLPDAPVFDLQFHPTQRLLRAATHGRGIYEWNLAPPGGRRRVVRH